MVVGERFWAPPLCAALILGGCIGASSDEGSTPATTPSLAFPTDTQAQQTPPQVAQAGPFPQGQYYLQFAYALSFDDSPYVVHFVATVWDAAHAPTAADAAAGPWAGEFNIAVWPSITAYEAREEPSCNIIEDMRAADHTAGTVTGLDYSSCEACDPINEVTFTYREDTGCDPAILDAWYHSDAGQAPVYSAIRYTGYRDPATDGWPPEFEDITLQLAAGGWTGAWYDTLAGALIKGGASFYPGYFVAPTNLGASLNRAPRARPMPATKLPSIAALRR